MIDIAFGYLQAMLIIYLWPNIRDKHYQREFKCQMSKVSIKNGFHFTGIFCHFKFYHYRRNGFSLSWFFFLSQFSFLKTFIFSVQCSESTDLWPVPHSTGKINLPAEFEGKIVRLKVFVVQWCFIMKLQNKVTRRNRFKLHLWAPKAFFCSPFGYERLDFVIKSNPY